MKDKASSYTGQSHELSYILKKKKKSSNSIIIILFLNKEKNARRNNLKGFLGVFVVVVIFSSFRNIIRENTN